MKLSRSSRVHDRLEILPGVFHVDLVEAVLQLLGFLGVDS